jgi:hypothetical protein
MVRDYSYDEIYGVDLDTYCKLQGITIDDLIESVEMDIKILKQNLNHQVWGKKNIEEMDFNLIGTIHAIINKKEKHLKRLKEWKNESSKNKK